MGKLVKNDIKDGTKEIIEMMEQIKDILKEAIAKMTVMCDVPDTHNEVSEQLRVMYNAADGNIMNIRAASKFGKPILILDREFISAKEFMDTIINMDNMIENAKNYTGKAPTNMVEFLDVIEKIDV